MSWKGKREEILFECWTMTTTTLRLIYVYTSWVHLILFLGFIFVVLWIFLRFLKQFTSRLMTMHVSRALVIVVKFVNILSTKLKLVFRRARLTNRCTTRFATYIQSMNEWIFSTMNELNNSINNINFIFDMFVM